MDASLGVLADRYRNPVSTIDASREVLHVLTHCLDAGCHTVPAVLFEVYPSMRYLEP